jgi:hypothetical protein
MMLNRLTIAAAAGFVLLTGPCLAATKVTIDLPKYNEDYSKLVAKAETSSQKIDFTALRMAWLKSEAYRHAGEAYAMSKNLVDAVGKDDHAAVREIAVKMLDLDYVNLTAQKYLYQSCQALHDGDCADNHRYIEQGLLGSIVRSGDGKSIDRAWTVVSVDEEAFVVGTEGMKATAQAVVRNDKGVFDKIDGTVDGKPATYYFNVSAFVQPASAK